MQTIDVDLLLRTLEQRLKIAKQRLLYSQGEEQTVWDARVAQLKEIIKVVKDLSK